ncbi:hypothetical protein HYPSUDRAFT_68407 [Hypholoma sublateritium FD-334 SS-4]|uniref:Uncharacterized protein n=1 Tax=Hypholoma sublateritium (strain FD-334 SS-4) TaxID=945553 RepID=A0A0D2L1E1_HYPSF|nr:hypothetical protein HYPSUDRAFT_68407 [Hypholoma sublateritium FD-334 SS-4]
MADSNPAPGASNAKLPLLTMVLLPIEAKGSEEGVKRYTTMRFPASYKDAVDAALKGFVRYVPATTGKAQPDDFEMLCPRRDHENKLVWATFDAADWDRVVEELIGGEMLGIRKRRALGKEGQPGSTDIPSLDEEPFVVGNVGLSYGIFQNGTIIWSPVQAQDAFLSPQIKRPKSYSEAIELVKSVRGRPGFPTPEVLESPDLQIKFHKFTSARGGKPTTDFWVDLPEEACPHGFIWRLFVPKPFEILGFTLQKRSNLLAANADGSARDLIVTKLEA